MNKFDFAIVGSGMYGATLARLLVDNGFSVIVLEEKGWTAGACKTEVIHGDLQRIPIHKYGPHIFHTSNDRVWRFVCDHCDMVPFVNSPIAIAGDNKAYHLPFNMDTFYSVYGTYDRSEIESILSDDRKKYSGGSEDNLENKAISLVGRKIYELLIRDYTEKQWGTKCSDLPASIITRIPLRFSWNNNYFNDIYQGIPADGYSPLIENLLDGTTVMLGYKVTHKNLSSLRSLAKTIVYTGRLDDFYDNELGSLDYRSIYLSHDVCTKSQGNAVINYTSHNVPYTRTIEHKYFYPKRTTELNTTYISYEYPCKPEESGNYFYPINDDKNDKLHSEYVKKSRKDGIYIGGRLASYKYINMDKAVADAMVMAIDLSMSHDN